MSSLHDGTEQEQASCSDGYAGESSDESSDDEDDESDNDGESEDVDEEDKGTLGVKKRAKNNKHKPRCSNADDGDLHFFFSLFFLNSLIFISVAFIFLFFSVLFSPSSFLHPLFSLSLFFFFCLLVASLSCFVCT